MFAEVRVSDHARIEKSVKTGRCASRNDLEMTALSAVTI
jgi:hypothetical protein